jgi:glycosidase
MLAGLTGAGAMAQVDTSPVAFQDTASSLPEGWQKGAFMEIFVRGYKDSNGDGVGDLRGLTQSLDYLRDLGVRGLWLMPITASADHDHGYATADYRQVEAAYGNLQDLDELLKQAHARGMGVIIDYVINHSARTHPLFVDAASSPASSYRDWFVWQPQAPSGWDIWGKNPWTQTQNGAFFATFGPHMPDFNLRNPQVLAYHQDSLRFWLNRGLDGFRLDAVPHLIENSAAQWNDQPESRRLTHDLRELITRYSRRHVVCEATANPLVYGAADVCGSAFAFGHEANIVKAAKGEPQAIAAVANYFVTAPQSMATMVSNHDIFAGERLWDQVAGDMAQYRLAAATYLLQPGTPFIYYGEEIGMAGVKGLPGDAPLRTPMSWRGDAQTAGFTSSMPFRPVSPNAATHNVQAEQGDPNSLLTFYQAMLKLRNSYVSIAQGSYEAPLVQGKLMSYQRKLGPQHTLVLINYGTYTASTDIQALPARSKWLAAYPTDAPAMRADGRGALALAVPPQSVLVYVLQPR